MTIGRPVEYDLAEALRAALQLFWARGYKGASLEELCGVTQMSKSTLYTVFGDKRRLFLASVQAYTDNLVTELRTQLRASRSPLRFIRRVFADLAAEAGGEERNGCLVMNTATEFAQTDPEVAQIVAQSIDRMVAVFDEALRDATARNEVEVDDPHAMARHLVTSIAGMKTMVKAGRSRGELSSFAEFVLQRLAPKELAE
jgi:TetR/AcrR family transcriptional repressor of nem operon